MKKDKWVSQQTETLVKNRVTRRNNYRSHRNWDKFNYWKEARKLTDESFENDQQRFLENKCLQAGDAGYLAQSSKVYSITRDISGKSITDTAKLVTKQNYEPPTNNLDLRKEWAM